MITSNPASLTKSDKLLPIPASLSKSEKVSKLNLGKRPLEIIIMRPRVKDEYFSKDVSTKEKNLRWGMTLRGSRVASVTEGGKVQEGK